MRFGAAEQFVVFEHARVHDRHERAVPLLVETSNGREVDLVVRGLRVLERVSGRRSSAVIDCSLLAIARLNDGWVANHGLQ